MRIAFAGTPEFARAALARMIASGFSPQWVLTQPDRPAGRGMRPQPSPVKQLAEQHGIAVLQPHGLKLDGRYAEQAAATREALAASELDVLVVAAYGLILPRWLLDLPRHGCLNIHASLLPRWRGAAPIHRAIEAGDRQTGVAIMQMDEGLDTGAVVASHAIPIAPEDTTGSLHDRLAALGADAIVQALTQLQHGPLASQPQPAEGVTYAEKISRAESHLDFSLPAEVLAQRVRAFNPFPGAQGSLRRHEAPAASPDGETIKIWAAHVVEEDLAATAPAVPGTIVAVDRASGIAVACGDQRLLCLTELQRAGGKRLPAAQFLNGFTLQPGDRLVSPRA